MQRTEDPEQHPTAAPEEETGRCHPIRRRDDGYFAVMVVGLPSSPTKTTRTFAGTLPLLNSWCG